MIDSHESELKTARSCYAIVLKHNASWWLVEFANVGTDVLGVFPLSGRMSPGLIKWLQKETGDATLTDAITSLHPDPVDNWSGEFMLAPSIYRDGTYDLVAHPWGSSPSEKELSMARASISGSIN